MVTGAGSGIGRGIAEHAAKAGMRLVLADINEEGLNETLALVKSCGVEAISRVTDVSSLDEVENLASQTYETFQNCHLLFNNAVFLDQLHSAKLTEKCMIGSSILILGDASMVFMHSFQE